MIGTDEWMLGQNKSSKRDGVSASPIRRNERRSVAMFERTIELSAAVQIVNRTRAMTCGSRASRWMPSQCA